MVMIPQDGLAPIILLPFRESENEDRLMLIEKTASSLFEETSASECLVIAVNVDRGDYPYSTLAVCLP